MDSNGKSHEDGHISCHSSDHSVMDDLVFVVGGHLHEAGDEGGLGHHHSKLPQLVWIQLKASPDHWMYMYVLKC